jgi:transcriptional regulator with XRE-family HTH domain
VSESLARTLARAIRAERGRAGLSQQALAARLGMNRSTITQIENLTRRVYADELPEICEALGVSLADLLGRVEDADRRRLRL